MSKQTFKLFSYLSLNVTSCQNLNVTSVCVRSCRFPATAKALCGLQRRDSPGVAQQVSPVRPSLRRVLPGAGPLLRLGRTDVLAVHPGIQKVQNSPCPAHLIRVRPALIYNKEDKDKDLACHVS